jgi:hypothetical protein
MAIMYPVLYQLHAFVGPSRPNRKGDVELIQAMVTPHIPHP